MKAPELGWLTWLAMLLVLAAAAVLSFAALRDLAELCGVAPFLAPLLPVAIDAGAAVSTKVWLDGRAVVAERYARALTFALLAATVAGNALHGGLIAAAIRPAWWVAVAVTAVPPAIVGAVVHLAVLVGRPVAGDSSSTARAELSPIPAPCSSPVQGAADGRPPRFAAQGNVEVDQAGPGASAGLPAANSNVNGIGSVEVNAAPDRAAALIAEGAGRRRLAKELRITEHQARELLGERRNGVTR